MVDNGEGSQIAEKWVPRSRCRSLLRAVSCSDADRRFGNMQVMQPYLNHGLDSTHTLFRCNVQAEKRWLTRRLSYRNVVQIPTECPCSVHGRQDSIVRILSAAARKIISVTHKYLASRSRFSEYLQPVHQCISPLVCIRSSTLPGRGSII